MKKSINISVRPEFEFLPTVLSHGWHELPPFRFDEGRKVIERVHRLAGGKLAKLTIGSNGVSRTLPVTIEAKKALSKDDLIEIDRVVRRCLSTEQDLAPFYARLAHHPRYRWVRKMGAGRLLASPTVWEDLAKVLLTTNTTWNVTVQMCRRLASLGESLTPGVSSFPTPVTIARMSLTTFSDRVRIGYRAPYLHALAGAIAGGQLDVEAWSQSDIPSDDLFRQIKSIKGFGDYAAGTVLRLLGRHDRLGIDTGCRAVFRSQLNAGRSASDSEITAYYEPFGEWRGLAMWMDVMNVNMRSKVGSRLT